MSNFTYENMKNMSKEEVVSVAKELKNKNDFYSNMAYDTAVAFISKKFSISYVDAENIVWA